jgi:hypothetical protein
VLFGPAGPEAAGRHVRERAGQSRRRCAVPARSRSRNAW